MLNVGDRGSYYLCSVRTVMSAGHVARSGMAHGWSGA